MSAFGHLGLAGLMSPSPTRVLLTGATGLIGGELLYRLVTAGVGSVRCLVRRSTDCNGVERLWRRLRRSHQLAYCDVMKAVGVVEGDLRDSRLGLSLTHYRQLASDVNYVIHCAADTSFLGKRSALRANRDGTRHLTEFATSCEQLMGFLYVGTAAAAGRFVDCTVAEDSKASDHYNDYTKSKALAEDIVRGSGLPYLIVRPSIVLSDGIRDRAFARSLLWFVPLLSQFEALPINSESRLDIVTVSYCVEAILGLVESPDRTFECYHISAGSASVTAAEMLRAAADYYGWPRSPDLVHPRQWTGSLSRRHFRTRGQRQVFGGLRYYLPFINMNVIYDNRRIKSALGFRHPRCRVVTDYFANLLAQVSYEDAVLEACRP